MLLIGIGVLLVGSLPAQDRLTSPAWQSMKIIQTVDPIFPASQLLEGTTGGDARVVINTDQDGKLADYLIVAYSDRPFADAAVQAIKQWTFLPAQLDGVPVGTTVELSFHFEARGVVISTSNPFALVEAQIRRMVEDRMEYQPCRATRLDQEPKAVVTVAPEYPVALAKQGVRGSVTLDFFIDENGAVRLPSGSSTENNVLTSLALQALRQWKFSPPTSRGHAVLIRARQLFSFRPPMDATTG
jgi:TonB family protein